MRRLMTWAVAAVVPALLVSTLTIGCSGDNKTATEPAKPASSKKASKGGKGKLEELASTGTTTVKGRITLAGDKPNIDTLTADLNALVEKSQDKQHCLDAPPEQKGEQVWRFGQNNGVADVFVWLAPPEGKYFKIDWDKPTWPKEVVIDQPHCAFIPHAAVYFPGGYDPEHPKELKSSGQKFIIKNSSSFLHNTNWKGGDLNPGDNKPIAAGTQMEIKDLQPSPDPVLLKCNVHTWMNGVVRVFDHPYATVTDKDGNYEIKGVPAGAELNIVVWHEEAGFGNKGKDGDKVTLKAGEDNEHDYTVKAK